MSGSAPERYRDVLARIKALLIGDEDWIAAMATVACELHHAIDHFHWTGFYRVTSPQMLTVGPYQGGHGCLSIPFSRGVCGAAARTGTTQLVPDVHAFSGHIACSFTTKSELVVPIKRANGDVFAVLDIDSDIVDAFDEVDRQNIEQLCRELGHRYGETSR